jgi:EAL domain-containing protein (putative c-di-GMP-specific phosphodiesterase class I)
VVAEGVESETALKVLAEMQCDMVQGFFISKPLSATEVAEFAATWTLGDRMRLHPD